MAQFVSYSQEINSTSTTSVIINKPNNVQVGDLMIAHVTYHNSSSTISAPSDWAQLIAPTLYVDSISAVYYKYVTTSEPSSYTFTTPSTYSIGSIIAFRNAYIQTQAYSYNSTASTTLTAPSVTANAPGVLLNLYGLHNASSATISLAEETLIYSATNGGGYCVQGAFIRDITSGTYGPITATASSSGGSIGYSIVLGTNTPSNAPINLSPSGTLQSPQLVDSLNPTLSWTFSDPDAGQTQGSFQVIGFNAADQLMISSVQITSATSSAKAKDLGSVTILPDTVYGWSVRTWDNGPQAQPSPFADYQYFRTPPAVAVTNLAPNTTASVTSLTPRLTWEVVDQYQRPSVSYQVVIQSSSTSQTVYDSGQVNSSNTYMDVPAGKLIAGTTYKWNVTVWDDLSYVSNNTNWATFVTNTAPTPPTLVSPADNARNTNYYPAFVATIGQDAENDNQHFRFQMATDSNFTSVLYDYSTLSSTGSWEVCNGTSWTSFPAGGVDSTFVGKQVRMSFYQMVLPEKRTYYWRLAAIDATTNAQGAWSTVRSVRLGTTLQFKLKNPIITPTLINKIVLTGAYKLATDGATPATLKVEVCNNGLDGTPYWEDATIAFLNGSFFTLTNTSKSGTNWAVDCRVTIVANDSMNPIEFDGIGFAW